MRNRAAHGKSAIPIADSTSAPTITGRRPRPAALARSDAVPAHGARSTNKTVSIAIRAPIVVRWSPNGVCTSGGMNALRSGPVTPEKRPPRPTHTQTAEGIRADGASGSSVTPQYCCWTVHSPSAHRDSDARDVFAGRREQSKAGLSVYAADRAGAFV